MLFTHAVYHYGTTGIAMGVVKFLTDMGLFKGQSAAFFKLLRDLAQDADSARRGLLIWGYSCSFGLAVPVNLPPWCYD